MNGTINNLLGNNTVIGITMGDPGGIGPEIVVKALADPMIRRLAKFVIFGLDEQLEYAADLAEVEPFWLRHPHEKISRNYPRQVVVADYDEYSVPAWVHASTRVSGEASMRFCLDAIDAARDGLIDAIVTAPISKTSWHLAESPWTGHTEMLADRCKSPRKVMMFVAGPLKLALATIHEPLFEIRHKFTIGCVFEPIDLLDMALKQYFGIAKPHIAVAGLNPHAGEDGQFGDEERRIISPAILLAQEAGINCTGPYPADTLFYHAVHGAYDGVVAMYHDQGLIPIKMAAFDQAVNVTLGLPIIRTSPGHGTAFDIAGKGIANPNAMKEAIRVAVQMAKTSQKNKIQTGK
ncbi:MAG TPA: 4-hydroxythreonine-4-phosphate dehydrogenase PdxA [Anaerohalosphaeraceae bacterium]|nr:4-hydroxythreonine-4-phosphate dehydrogenase PdxA [Phycisphaerae bacterium]HOL30814.1 4-hydroxythreonine-4-phosphate dehydrogenase PdxA [Anaerohalosphaeraceae bacterium]HOM75782.1 4-hydroxythreonine-4-phosphate dehydrogenase PdxA [Anaerohalosphaeraceae bacterium]HPC64534.1 4-hydroxythreonine-4-phosphate dehydrogenase PdxA [Anaerohalosphaeraceae bacterium]HPO70959.1 4-hydroxythreonine-4-phosphate dehydrogenase PdxA [Anaerohalosphaeraceae bacterium]